MEDRRRYRIASIPASARDVAGRAIDCGDLIQEEAPAALLAACDEVLPRRPDAALP